MIRLAKEYTLYSVSETISGYGEIKLEYTAADKPILVALSVENRALEVVNEVLKQRNQYTGITTDSRVKQRDKISRDGISYTVKEIIDGKRGIRILNLYREDEIL